MINFYQHLSSRSKTYAMVLGFLLLIGLVLSSFAFAFGYGVRGWWGSDEIKVPRQISVGGEGKIAMKPDMATFTAGVVTQAKKIKDAQADNNARSAAVTDFLKGQGIEEKDLQTVGYTIMPQYQYFSTPPCYTSLCPVSHPPEITGYEVRHTIEVKVRTLDKVDALLDGVVGKGANEVGSIQFGFQEDTKIRDDARAKAIDNAKTKAQTLAQELGVRLGKIVSFSESGGGYPIYAERAYGMGGGGATLAPSVQAGEQEITSSVTITYELK